MQWWHRSSGSGRVVAQAGIKRLWTALQGRVVLGILLQMLDANSLLKLTSTCWGIYFENFEFRQEWICWPLWWIAQEKSEAESIEDILDGYLQELDHMLHLDDLERLEMQRRDMDMLIEDEWFADMLEIWRC